MKYRYWLTQRLKMQCLCNRFLFRRYTKQDVKNCLIRSPYILSAAVQRLYLPFVYSVCLLNWLDRFQFLPFQFLYSSCLQSLFLNDHCSLLMFILRFQNLPREWSTSMYVCVYIYNYISTFFVRRIVECMSSGKGENKTRMVTPKALNKQNIVYKIKNNSSKG